MSSEARTIRPFLKLESFEQALKSPVLHFGQDVCRPGSSTFVNLKTHEFGLRPVEIEWAPSEEQFRRFKEGLRESAAELEVELAAVSVVAVARTSYLKDAAIVLNVPLNDLESLERVSRLSDGGRPAPFKAWRHGFTVDVHVLLNRSVEPRPLHPWRLGTWFARSRFAIKTDRSTRQLYRPIPLDDEQRDELNLSSGTTRFVRFNGHDPTSPYEQQGIDPEFYIDADLIARLNADSSSTASEAIQLDLALHFISAVVYATSPELEDTTTLDDVEDSLLERIILLCAGHDEQAKKRVLNDIRSRPERVIARAEDKVGIRKALIRSIEASDL